MYSLNPYQVYDNDLITYWISKPDFEIAYKTY